jgi:hypothetical protein
MHCEVERAGVMSYMKALFLSLKGLGRIMTNLSVGGDQAEIQLTKNKLSCINISLRDCRSDKRRILHFSTLFHLVEISLCEDCHIPKIP